MLEEKKKWTWKRVLKEVVIMGLLVLVVSNVISYIRQPALENIKLPQINETLISGENFDSDVYGGKPLLIHFWATWCPVCKAEADNIERLSHYYNVVTFAVQSGSDEEIKTFMQEQGLHYRVINDEQGKWAGRFSVNAYPTSFIYDSEGKVSSSEVGYTSTLGMALRMWWAD
ncbi:protein disulfide oxidoreductase [bacterium]|nr:protein disulfide oxidoreductase [bacterium]